MNLILKKEIRIIAERVETDVLRNAEDLLPGFNRDYLGHFQEDHHESRT